MAAEDLVEELSALYSEHYGIWSSNAPVNPGEHVRLSPARLRRWLTPESKIALAKVDGHIVGYAIAVQAKVRDYGVISWITQLVVHEEHRRQDVGKTLLFSIWGFSNHYAWGLITANPYAVRALEKATRRRCLPERIAKNKRKLASLGGDHVPYMDDETGIEVTGTGSRIHTEFFVSHATLDAMVADVTTSATPWTLGTLADGWEWLAFTFHDQPEIGLTPEEIEKMLTASDQVAKRAYSRMLLNSSHRWAQHAPEEATRIVEYCNLTDGQTVLDLGCGSGRHVLELAARGLEATGVDYLEHLIRSGREQASARNLSGAQFLEGDSRHIDLGQNYDAVVCLYDVIGSYSDQGENSLIVKSIVRHLKPGGMALISVMNFELTKYKAKHFFSLAKEPNRLLELEPSQTMEQTGNVFDPDFYMVDEETGIVYRKEQFAEGDGLPVQLVVRDRRYLRPEIEAMCEAAGLEVVWSRFVRAGNWSVDLDPCHERAKEILLLCRRPS